MAVFLLVAFVLPAYKTYVRNKKLKMFDTDTKKQNKIHPKVIEQLKAKADMWKTEKREEEEEEDLGHIFDARDSDGEAEQEDELETEILPMTAPNSRELDPHGVSADLDSDEGQPAPLWPGATNLAATNDQSTGRWGHARSRLKALEMQLDELLEKLPTAQGGEDTSASVASDLMSEVGAPRERARYSRPALPDLSLAAPLGATAETQPIRRVRRGTAAEPPVPTGQSSRPVVSTVRRAPKLTAMIDELTDDSGGAKKAWG